MQPSYVHQVVSMRHEQLHEHQICGKCITLCTMYIVYGCMDITSSGKCTLRYADVHGTMNIINVGKYPMLTLTTRRHWF